MKRPNRWIIAAGMFSLLIAADRADAQRRPARFERAADSQAVRQAGNAQA